MENIRAGGEDSLLRGIWTRAVAIFVMVTAPVWMTGQWFWEKMQQYRFFSPKRMEAQFTYSRKRAFGMVLVWTVLLWIVIGYKFVNESVSEVIEYYTNITAIIQAVYYTLDLMSYFADPKRRTLEVILLFVFYFPMLAQTFDVFMMVIFVYLDNATIITENIECGGGEYDAGVVLAYDRFVHVFPLIVAVVYGVLRVRDITDVLISAYGVVYTRPIAAEVHPQVDQCVHARTSFIMRRTHSWVYIIYQYIVAALPFMLYAFIQNVRTVYGVDTFTNWMGVLAVFVLNLVCVVLPLDMLIFAYIPWRDIPSNIMLMHKPTINATVPQITHIREVPRVYRDEEIPHSHGQFFDLPI